MKKILNIVLVLLFAITAGFVAWAVVSGGADVAISWNLMWGYALIVGAVVCILCGAVANMIQNPASLKKTGLAVVIVLAIVGGAVGIALSNGSQPIPTAEGGFFDDPFELAISEVGLLVTYAVAAASILATVVAEIRNVLK
ncbi:MAG: hypothetical protein J6Q20_04045 [Alistipes sp.]|nr:hypothetical protein [Alistipes sp.]